MKLFLVCFFAIISIIAMLFKQNDPLEESIKRGGDIYSEACITCHLPNGTGVSGIFPPLAKSDFLTNKREESIKAIKYGLKGEITVNNEVYNNNMTPYGLSDGEVADVMNYINNSWGNENGKIVTIEEVAAIIK